jgi:hypothetical protein
MYIKFNESWAADFKSNRLYSIFTSDEVKISGFFYDLPLEPNLLVQTEKYVFTIGYKHIYLLNNNYVQHRKLNEMTIEDPTKLEIDFNLNKFCSFLNGGRFPYGYFYDTKHLPKVASVDVDKINSLIDRYVLFI